MTQHRNTLLQASKVATAVVLLVAFVAAIALDVHLIHGSGTGGITPLSLSLSPATQTASIGGGQGLVVATLRDAATSALVPGARLSFAVETGPNTGISGTCFPSTCTTDSNGQVDWGYQASNIGTDTVEGWVDSNGNGLPDGDEPQATAGVSWVYPTTSAESGSWAGYVLTNPPLRSVTALITVPTVPSGCATSRYSSFWVGFNGWIHDTNFLPQIGFNADCRASDVARNTTACGPQTGPAYYLWWELNPHTGLNSICSLQVRPGDRVFVNVQPSASQVILTAFVMRPDGSIGPTWSQTFPVRNASYSSMECIAEDPLSGRPVPFTSFGSVQFDGCSAIRDFRAGSTLLRVDMFMPGRQHVLEATTSPITMSGAVSFTVARVDG